MRIKKLLLTLWLALVSPLTFAGISLVFHSVKRDDAAYRLYIQGVGNGIYSFNLLLTSGGNPAFCVPDGLMLDEEYYIQLLNEYSENIQEIPGAAAFTDVETAISIAMRKRYPC